MQSLTAVKASPNGTTRNENPRPAAVKIDGVIHEAFADDRIIDLINHARIRFPQVCYHPQLGPVQTCDTGMVEIHGRIVRACATPVEEGMVVSTTSQRAHSARIEG